MTKGSSDPILPDDAHIVPTLCGQETRISSLRYRVLECQRVSAKHMINRTQAGESKATASIQRASGT